jgi:hypothetical protein
LEKYDGKRKGGPMPKGNNKKKKFYFLMKLAKGDLQAFEVMAKSKRFAKAQATVIAGLGSEIVEYCKKGDMSPSPQHPKLQEFMAKNS